MYENAVYADNRYKREQKRHRVDSMKLEGKPTTSQSENSKITTL